MKNIRRKFFAVTLIAMMLFATVSGIFNKSYADSKYLVPSGEATEYQFNAGDILLWAAIDGTSVVDPDEYPFIVVTPTPEQFKVDKTKSKYPEYILLSEYRPESSNLYGRTNATDATELLIGNNPRSSRDPFKIVEQLSKDLSIAPEDIVMNIRINLRDDNDTVTWVKKGKSVVENGETKIVLEPVESEETIKAYTEKIFNYCKRMYLSGKYANSVGSGTEEDWEELYNDSLQYAREHGAQNEEEARYAAMRNTYNDYNESSFFVTEIDAILPDGTKYCLVLADGDTVSGENYTGDTYTRKNRHWALARKGLFVPDDDRPDRDSTPDPEPDSDIGEPAVAEALKTTLDYVAVDGNEIVKKGSDSPFLAPYTENDKDVKDTDVVAYIRSTTKQDLVITNGVDMKTDGTANSEGWYYPDTNDKTVIAKLYPFDTYNNNTYNGIAKETVEVKGTSHQIDSQTPYIKWTFRRLRKDITTNDDKSTTVTITFNLPIDKESIPDGWSPKYDADGSTIHAITRNFKSDETYNKDVVVKQNGTGAEVTTKVSIAPNVLAKTGESIAVVFAILAIAIVAVKLYGKNKKLKKIK